MFLFQMQGVFELHKGSGNFNYFAGNPYPAELKEACLF